MPTCRFTVTARDGRSWTVSAGSPTEAINKVAAERGVPHRDLKARVSRGPS